MITRRIAHNIAEISARRAETVGVKSTTAEIAMAATLSLMEQCCILAAALKIENGSDLDAAIVAATEIPDASDETLEKVREYIRYLLTEDGLYVHSDGSDWAIVIAEVCGGMGARIRSSRIVGPIPEFMGDVTFLAGPAV